MYIRDHITFMRTAASSASSSWISSTFFFLDLSSSWILSVHFFLALSNSLTMLPFFFCTSCSIPDNEFTDAQHELDEQCVSFLSLHVCNTPVELQCFSSSSDTDFFSCSKVITLLQQTLELDDLVFVAVAAASTSFAGKGPTAEKVDRSDSDVSTCYDSDTISCKSTKHTTWQPLPGCSAASFKNADILGRAVACKWVVAR